ncbi:hypothetical protein SDC9_137733 [bioreactor metagenome]|uniref:Uncharacterized protein n=1 Tax=bioreactor metagenome TaxID=1076179 RepID=A0A645DQ53_9ZZZZ
MDAFRRSAAFCGAFVFHGRMSLRRLLSGSRRPARQKFSAGKCRRPLRRSALFREIQPPGPADRGDPARQQAAGREVDRNRADLRDLEDSRRRAGLAGFRRFVRQHGVLVSDPAGQEEIRKIQPADPGGDGAVAGIYPELSVRRTQRGGVQPGPFRVPVRDRDGFSAGGRPVGDAYAGRDGDRSKKTEGDDPAFAGLAARRSGRGDSVLRRGPSGPARLDDQFRRENKEIGT